MLIDPQLQVLLMVKLRVIYSTIASFLPVELLPKELFPQLQYRIIPLPEGQPPNLPNDGDDEVIDLVVMAVDLQSRGTAGLCLLRRRRGKALCNGRCVK